jgi:hypothetical protein
MVLAGIAGNGGLLYLSMDMEEFRKCVNPSHLWLGTQIDNIMDMKSKLRTTIGIKSRGSKLTEGKVKFIRNLYATGCYTKQKIADLFSLNYKTIDAAIRRISYRTTI